MFWRERIDKLLDDGAPCLELSSLSWLASTQVKALGGIRKLVDDVVADMAGNGEDVPLPLADRHFSGRFNICIPPDLHPQLASKPRDHHMNPNRFDTDRLPPDCTAPSTGKPPA